MWVIKNVKTNGYLQYKVGHGFQIRHDLDTATCFEHKSDAEDRIRRLAGMYKLVNYVTVKVEPEVGHSWKLRNTKKRRECDVPDRRAAVLETRAKRHE